MARPFAVEIGVPAGIDFHLAAIAVARGDTATARRLLTGIAPAFDGGLTRPRRAALRQLQADLHLLLDDPSEALALAEDGLRDQSTYPDLDLAWKLQWRRAKALSELGKDAQSVDAFRAGMSHADRLRMAPLGYRLDTSFVRDKLPMAEEAVDAALDHHGAGAVAWCVETVKSRALAATISVARAPAADPTEQEAEFDAVSQQIDALAFAQYNGSGSAGTIQTRLHLIARRDDLLEQIRIGVGVDQLLPATVAERLGSTETLLVVPHGLLHLLPWGCLTAGSERLFQRCAVGKLVASLTWVGGPGEPAMPVDIREMAPVGGPTDVEFPPKEPGVYRLHVEGPETEDVSDLLVVAPA